MPITVSCSHCQANFKVADNAAGKTLKCRQCKKPFKAVADEDEEEMAAPVKASGKAGKIASGPPPLAAKRRRVEEDEDDEDEEPRRGSGKRRRDEEEDRPKQSRNKRKKKSNLMLILGLCAGGGVLVLAIAGVGITLLVMSLRRAPEPARKFAAAPPPVKAVEAANPAQPAPAKPNQAAPPVVPNGQPQAAPANGNGLKPGTKVTIRAEIQGSPPDFNGDFNKQVVQNLEIALRQKGFTPVPDGGQILTVSAQVSNTGKSIQVRSIGPRPKFKPGQPPPNQVQVYPIEQITAKVVLTDAQGTAIWQQEARFVPLIIIFRTGNPPREMQEQMWRSFETWTRGSALTLLKQ